MKRTLLLSVSFVLLVAASTAWAEQITAPRPVAVVRVVSPLNALTARFIDSRIAAAERAGARLLVIDAHFSQGYSSSVGEVVDHIRASRIPVIVMPRGNAMASDSAIGYLQRAGAVLAPTPAGGGSSRSAVARGGEIGASTLPADEFVSSLDGRTISFHGRGVTLHTNGVPIRVYEMNGVARLIAGLLDPNLAYVLLVVGILGIAIEFSLPGVGLPGILGGLSLLISLVSLGALSVNIGGLLIVVLALALFIIDIKAPTHGVLTAGGIVALLVGSFLLFPSHQTLPGLSPVRISPTAIIVMTGLLSLVAVTAVIVATKAQHRKVVVGRESLIGLSGVALTDVNPEGVIRVGNEEWSATSVGDEIKAGDEVDVVDVQGVHLVIMRRP